MFFTNVGPGYLRGMSSLPWSWLLPGLSVLLPLLLGAGALARLPSPALSRAVWLTTAASGVAVAVAVGVAVSGAQAHLGGAALGVRVDHVTAIMLLLVCVIGAVIARYSRRYMDGDPGRDRYGRWLLSTLAAVTLLVMSNNLWLLALAWMATSLSLHRLLTFYGDRTAALVAAHKKFIVSRLADAALLVAIALVGRTVGSVDIDAIEAWASAHDTLPPSLQVATLLLVAAASLKCAQLPFHGWLTQVMEAPTPVSALLHAGIVNIGGFLMIRLAPLMARAPAAQTALVCVGTCTAVVAALVMVTRVSVKVGLAWSTCAQMGFMLVQCGLGAWHLALLHLVAHSLYKAHAFLSAGSVVAAWRARELQAPRGPASMARVLAVAAVVLVGAEAARRLSSSAPWGGAEVSPLAVVFALSLAPSLADALGGGLGPTVRVAARVTGAALLYVAWHAVAARHVVVAASEAGASLRWGIVLGGLSTLFLVETALRSRPDGRLARALYPRLFAGLHLDELFTRATFRLWPPRLPASGSGRGPLAAAESAGA